MYFSNFLNFFTALSLASSAAIQPALKHRTLTEDDVIVWGSNRVEVMNKTSYALLKSQQASSSANLTTSPTIYNATSLTSTDTSLSSRTLSSRCSKETIYSVNPPTTFLNWDVPMSSVLKAGSTGTTTVSVTSGYSIANSVTATASVTLIAEFLQSSFSVSYSETWTSTYAAAYSFNIPAGKYGVVVSNPQTTRRTGTVAIGCIADATTTSFQADSYTSQAYGGLSWVEGTITLCTGDTYPVPRCTGQGTLS